MAVTEPLNGVAMPAECVLDLAPAVHRSVEVRERKVTRILPRRPDLAQIAARRIAAVARRDELGVQRASLWSELLELDDWRRDLATECRAATRRHQELIEALAAERHRGTSGSAPVLGEDFVLRQQIAHVRNESQALRAEAQQIRAQGRNGRGHQASG